MTYIKAISGLLSTAVAVGAFAATQASASSAPIVIAYEKTCNTTGHCQGTANGVTIDMQVDFTTFRATGDAFQYTLTETIKVGDDISFTAVMNAHQSPAGFIVLNGTVTKGSFVGAQVHQRSNLVSVSPDGTTSWTGELQLMPASA
jgi:hypothetical protein